VIGRVNYLPSRGQSGDEGQLVDGTKELPMQDSPHQMRVGVKIAACEHCRRVMSGIHHLVRIQRPVRSPRTGFESNVLSQQLPVHLERCSFINNKGSIDCMKDNR